MAIPLEGLAFLDAVAEGESTEAARRGGISPYFILVGGGSFEGLPERSGYFGFPDWPGRRFAAGMSHAAGRYQFEPATWRGICEQQWAPDGSDGWDFRNPEHQDYAAWVLALEVYRRPGSNLLADLRAGHLAGIATALRSTWTSLSEATFASRYREALQQEAAKAATKEVMPDTPVEPHRTADKPVPSSSGAGAIDPDSEEEAERLNEAELKRIEGA